MIAVVTGAIATYPVGGVAWDYGQYALGLERLGFDVYYLEDNGLYTYDADANAYGEDCTYGIRYLSETLTTLSPTLGGRWHFRHFDGATHGLPRDELLAIVADADLFLNVSGICLLRDEYMPARRKVFIDTDPGWNHFHWFPLWDREPPPAGVHTYRAHDAFFTYALGLGEPGCPLPDQGLEWHATRPPVALDLWTPNGGGDRWTTVLTWDNYRQPIEWEGHLYGSKEAEFERVEQLPSRTRSRLEVAAGGEGAPTSRWRDLGWSVVDAPSVSRSPGDYRSYIERSRGEFSVAKHVYVASRSGWFSCRTTCYLAAGKPSVVQDTGFGAHLPTGDGLIGFSTIEEAAAAIERVEADIDHHRRAAREVAVACFDAETVLADLVERAGV